MIGWQTEMNLKRVVLVGLVVAQCITAAIVYHEREARIEYVEKLEHVCLKAPDER